MKIKLKRDCGFTVVERYDEETDTAEEYDETFTKGEILDGDIVDDEGDYISWQFGDGSMVFGLKKKDFEVIEDD